jgi:hypothetical protein
VLAQEPALEVFYSKLEPKQQFKYKWQGKEGVCSAGVFRWEVPQSEFGTNGFDRNFTGYCAEVLVPIVADKTYRFQSNNLYAPTNYSLTNAKAEARGVSAERRTRYVLELFGRYFQDSTTKNISSDDAAAFQIALWEIIQESEPAEGEAKFDLFGGDFQANYPKNEAPVAVNKAQDYLASLTGKDADLFFNNPDLRDRELVRLQGLVNADGSPTQSQYALRTKLGGGGVGGGNLNRALTGGGAAGGGFGAPLMGGGGAGAGNGGGLGGGGGFFGGGGTGNGRTVTTTTPGGGGNNTPPNNNPPPTTTNRPPVGGPNDPNDPNNPNNPSNPNNPVPAPAGLLLGVIALGTIGARYGLRAYAK